MIIDKIEDFCLKILEKIGLKKIADYFDVSLDELGVFPEEENNTQI